MTKRKVIVEENLYPGSSKRCRRDPSPTDGNSVRGVLPSSRAKVSAPDDWRRTKKSYFINILNKTFSETSQHTYKAINRKAKELIKKYGLSKENNFKSGVSSNYANAISEVALPRYHKLIYLAQKRLSKCHMARR
jgi:hypothetical protein